MMRHNDCTGTGCERCRLYDSGERPDAWWLAIGGDPAGGPPRPLRIAHVGTSMAMAGAELHLASLVKFLDPARARIVRCVVTNPQAFDQGMADSLGVPVVRGGRAEVREAAAACDVLLCWGGPLDDWLAGARPPVTVFIAHGEGVWTRRALEGCAKIADHVVAVSRGAKRGACRGFPTTVIPNGIDLARIAPTRPKSATRAALGFSPDDKILLYCGRFSDEKRPHTVIEAAALLPPEYKALLVGWGASEDALRRLAGQKIPGRFAFAEARGDVGDYYRAADAMVSCSAEEGFSLAILEAMFSSLPVIASRVGSVPEMLEAGPVVLPVGGSPGSVADAAQALDAPQRAAQVAAALAYAEENGHARTMAGRYCDLLERLWRRRAKPRSEKGVKR